jgi:pimeloyl-ACP methyl ester carboxylesterase
VKPEIRYARNGDVAIGYAVVGEGPEHLVYVSPFNNLDLVWENPRYARFIERLSSFARTVVVDRRGTGVSDRYSPADLPPLEDLVDDLAAVLAAVGGDRASLFGFSDAGALCAMFAATHPESVSGLILYATAARGTQAPDYPWQWSEQEWHDYLTRVRVAWGTSEYAEESLLHFNPSLAGDASMLAWWERFQRLSASPNAIYAQEQVFRDMDIRRLLPAIGVPTLVLHRAEDAIEPVGAGRFLAGEIADAEYVELPGADHFPWAGEQDALIAEVQRFLKRVRSDEDEAFDRVLATILFTDIVDSTAQAATMGDRRWSEVREQHDRVTRAQLARFRGREVKTWETASSPPSTDRHGACDALARYARRLGGSVWSFARACTPARSTPTVTTSEAWLWPSAPGSGRSRSRARSWSRPRSRISSSALDSASRTAASTVSRE